MFSQKEKTAVAKIVGQMTSGCNTLHQIIKSNNLEESHLNDLEQMIASLKRITIGFMQTDELEELIKPVKVSDIK